MDLDLFRKFRDLFRLTLLVLVFLPPRLGDTFRASLALLPGELEALRELGEGGELEALRELGEGGDLEALREPSEGGD